MPLTLIKARSDEIGQELFEVTSSGGDLRAGTTSGGISQRIIDRLAERFAVQALRSWMVVRRHLQGYVR
jgi:hypothetical protein